MWMLHEIVGYKTTIWDEMLLFRMDVTVFVKMQPSFKPNDKVYLAKYIKPLTGRWLFCYLFEGTFI